MPVKDVEYIVVTSECGELNWYRYYNYADALSFVNENEELRALLIRSNEDSAEMTVETFL